MFSKLAKALPKVGGEIDWSVEQAAPTADVWLCHVRIKVGCVRLSASRQFVATADNASNNGVAIRDLLVAELLKEAAIVL